MRRIIVLFGLAAVLWTGGTPARSADDADSWKLVHFIRHLPHLTEQHLQEMEGLNPRSRAEIEEELQDKQFLEGKDVDTPPPAPHHQHKEQP